jgi:hypothetical protein
MEKPFNEPNFLLTLGSGHSEFYTSFVYTARPCLRINKYKEHYGVRDKSLEIELSQESWVSCGE